MVRLPQLGFVVTLLAAAVTGVPAAVCGDYESALTAFRRGEIAGTLRKGESLARDGDRKAQFALWRAYKHGLAGAKDHDEAISWYRKNANQAYSPAQTVFGQTSYWRQTSDQSAQPSNQADAVKSLRQAAEQGNSGAQFLLGAAYTVGKSVPKDYEEAAQWYRRAAEQGNTRAQVALGVFHYQGKGVQQDYVEAYKWLTLAAEKGDRVAVDNKSSLRVRMTEEQIAEALRLAQEFKPQGQRFDAAVGGPASLSRAAVRDIQQRLRALGYDPGPVDGIPGRKTESAVRAFQRDRGFEPDGRLSGELYDRLQAKEVLRPVESGLAQLIEDLRDQDSGVRFDTARTLAELGPAAEPAIPALAAAFRQDPRLLNREMHAMALGSIGAAAVPALIKAMTDPELTVDSIGFNIVWVSRALALMGPGAREAVPALTAALTDDYRELKQKFEEYPQGLLIPQPPPESSAGSAVPFHEQLLIEVRTAVALALGAIGPDAHEAVPALIEALRREAQPVRVAAAIALAEIGGPKTESLIVPALADRLGDEDALVREASVYALAELTTPPTNTREDPLFRRQEPLRLRLSEMEVGTAEAFYWLERAARAGKTAAQHDLGALYLEGRGGFSNDPEAAAGWFGKAAEGGFVDAQVAFGQLYLTGRGVPQNPTTAFYWFERAASQGHPDAQAALGMLYARGEGVKQDGEQALFWLSSANEQGSVRAAKDLGLIYENGLGVAQDYEKARSWFMTAAQRGDPSAQWKLGGLYEHGRGVPRDYLQAHRWYSRAALEGHENAGRALLLLEKKMNFEQSKKATQRLLEE